MRVIFLDIDGVLNNARTNAKSDEGYTGISNSLVARLARIVKATDAKIVLTSTWKRDWDKDPNKCNPDGLYINKKFRFKSIAVMDKVTNTSSGSYYRGASIQNYLNEHSDITNYVVLDDEHFDYDRRTEMLPHIIFTDENVGLTEEHVEQAIKILTAV